MKNLNLSERTKKFSKEVIGFCRSIKEDTITRPLISQLIGSSTSIGANYSESSDSYSNKDLIHKMYLIRKEAKESIYWLELINSSMVLNKNSYDLLIQEAGELNKIFSAIIIKLKSSSKDL